MAMYIETDRPINNGTVFNGTVNKKGPLICCSLRLSCAGLLGGEVPVGLQVPVSMSGTVWSDISI